MKKLLFILSFLPLFASAQVPPLTTALELQNWDIASECSTCPIPGTKVAVMPASTSGLALRRYIIQQDASPYTYDGFHILPVANFNNLFAWVLVDSVMQSSNLNGSKTGNNATMHISSESNSGVTMSIADADSSITNEIELPTQSGQTNKILKTNGTIPAWANSSSLFTALAMSYVANQLTATLTPETGSNIVSNTVTIPALNPSPATVTRPVNGTAFIPSATQYTLMSYSVNIAIVNVLGANSNGYIFLEESANGTTGWTEVCSAGQATNILSSPTQRSTLYGVAKPGYSYRLRQSANPGGISTVTITYQSGQESPL